MRTLFRFLSVLALFVVVNPVLAADPNLGLLHRLVKTNWGGACAGKYTHLLMLSGTECTNSLAAGYTGKCTDGNTDGDHYVSTTDFPGSLRIYRLRLANACTCKNNYIFTGDESWKSNFINQGWVQESATYYAWPREVGSNPLNADWGLVPVYHAYSSSHCDNFYSEHPAHYDEKINTGLYSCGFESNPNCISYYAADGWVNVNVACSVPNCNWTLTGPGGWTHSGSGSFSSPDKKFPSHGYKLECFPMPGMTTLTPVIKKYYTYFTTNTITCQYECINECSYSGQRECYSGGYRVCQQTVQGCYTWGSVNSCDDGNSCTVGDGCSGGSCIAGSPMDCSYLNDSCNTGQCSYGSCYKQPKSGSCSDGDSCTTGDTCQNGTCQGTTKDCSYLTNSCNTGVCSGGSCFQQPKNGSCDDGNGCTLNDYCSNGVCMAGSPKDCSGVADQCNNGICSGGSCVKQAKSGACEDGNLCTLGDSCSAGVCQPGLPKDCSALNDACNTGMCSAGTCTKQAKSGSCDDGNACTVGDYCASGSCLAGAAMDCSHLSDQCNSGVCVGGQCQKQTKVAACEDGNLCTLNDTCAGGVCVPGLLKDCTHLSDQCNTGSCSAGVCVAQMKTGGCDDGNLCTIGDVCGAGTCLSGPPLDCSSKTNACTNGVCQGGACVAVPKPGMECQDGVACTDDSCDPTQGCLNQPNHNKCYDSNDCTSDECVPATGGCVNTPITAPCEDGDLCSLDDSCVAGTCLPGPSKQCDDSNVCTADSCNVATGACVFANTPTGPCDDSEPCTLDDHCEAGACAGTPDTCDDGIACTVDSCSSGVGCVHPGNDDACDDLNDCTDDICNAVAGCTSVPNESTCADGNPCSIGDHCSEGKCVGGLPKQCDDSNACTWDSCDSTSGNCLHEAATGTCDDGDPCTKDDVCSNGTCFGTVVPGCCHDDQECLVSDPTCATVSCQQNVCVETPFCAEGRCGTNACDASLDCGGCLPFATCIGGWCREKCQLVDKKLTRCTNDDATLEECVLDAASGEYFWQPSDCVALGEQGCAYSMDKSINVCCTPDCTNKQCGKPSACGISCGDCDAGQFCCMPGQPCAEAKPADKFACLDCCAGVECGPSSNEGCDVSCGSCKEGMACKAGKCVSGCIDAGVDEKGVCAGTMAWWCQKSDGKELLLSTDCAPYVATCCFDEKLGRVGCCTCENECEEQGWQCGKNSCGGFCGDDEGECPLGFSCVPETHQCLCYNPSDCYPDVPITEFDWTIGEEVTSPVDTAEPVEVPTSTTSGGCSSSHELPSGVGGLALLLALLAFAVRLSRAKPTA